MEASSSSLESSLASSRSETPTKKRCRLRVVKKEEEVIIDDKVKKERLESKTKPNEDVTVKMEEGDLNCKMEPESNKSKLCLTENKISNGKSTIDDDKTVHRVDSKLSSRDKCLMNNVNEKRRTKIKLFRKHSMSATTSL